MDPEIAAEDAAAISRSDSTGAGCVMPPGGVAHELLQLVVSLELVAGLFLFGNQVLGAQLFRELPYEADASPPASLPRAVAR